MSYREVVMWEVLNVLRRIGRGESKSAIARTTGHSRTTIRRYVATAVELGWRPGTDEPTETLAAAVTARHSPAHDRGPGEVEALLLPHRERIKKWLKPEEPESGRKRPPAAPSSAANAPDDPPLAMSMATNAATGPTLPKNHLIPPHTSDNPPTVAPTTAPWWCTPTPRRCGHRRGNPLRASLKTLACRWIRFGVKSRHPEPSILTGSTSGSGQFPSPYLHSRAKMRSQRVSQFRT